MSPAEYQRRLRREKKASQSTVLWETTLYRVYEKYQAYLHRHRLFDDNDMARLLLKSRMKPQRPYGVYGAVFVDECQDLTQMELLAIFHLLSGTRHKRMASDRCQMVQPTYFDEAGCARPPMTMTGRRGTGAIFWASPTVPALQLPLEPQHHRVPELSGPVFPHGGPLDLASG